MTVFSSWTGHTKAPQWQVLTRRLQYKSQRAAQGTGGGGRLERSPADHLKLLTKIPPENYVAFLRGKIPQN